MRFTICVATLTMAAIACAQGPAEGRREGRRMDPVFAALDSDHDGVISAEELKLTAVSLKKLDKNSDGKLTEDELRPARGPEGQGGPGAPPQEDLAETLMAFDKNGDGKLTKAELPERMQNLFARADADNDGLLTKDELRKLAASQRAPGAGGAGRPEGRGRQEGGPGGGPGGPGGPGGGMMRFSPILATLDADHDGVISADEITNGPSALKQLDKDGDGRLTQEEVRPNFGPRQGRPEGREQP